MPIYHLHAKVISRAKGQSICAAASYRSGEKIHDERYDQIHDYGRKQGVEHTEILAPDGAPEWARERVRLWNEVESKENRKDAQLAREYEIALPHEIEQDRRIDLVRQYAHDAFVSKGMVADIALHEPNRKGDERNYHAHILCTMRDIDGKGFKNKNREWNSKNEIEQNREKWAQYVNRELERNNINERVDHRTLAVQRQEALDKGNIKKAEQLDREPTTHKGSLITALERMGKDIKIRIKEWSMERAIQHDDYSKLQNKIDTYSIEQKQEAYNRMLEKREAEIERIKDEKLQSAEQTKSESVIDIPAEEVERQRQAHAEREAKMEFAMSEKNRAMNETITLYAASIHKDTEAEKVFENTVNEFRNENRNIEVKDEELREVFDDYLKREEDFEDYLENNEWFDGELTDIELEELRKRFLRDELEQEDAQVDNNDLGQESDIEKAQEHESDEGILNSLSRYREMKQEGLSPGEIYRETLINENVAKELTHALGQHSHEQDKDNDLGY